MRVFRRLIAALLTVLMLCSTAVAEAPFLQHADGWTLAETPVEVVLSADVISCMPYDDDRLAMLKQVTDKLSLRLRTGADEGCVTVYAGQSEAITLAYRGNAVQLSCIPEMAFTAQNDPMGMILGGSTGVNAPYGLSEEGESLLDDGWVLLTSLGPALESYGNRKNVKTSITDMGLARTCTDYTIPKGDVDALKETLLALCPDGWLKEIISGLTFSGKQTLRVYRTEDEIPLRMEYNGTCGPEGNLRTVKLVWRTRRDDVAHRDEVTLTSPAKTGTNKNNLEFKRVIQKNKKGALEMEGSFTYTVTADKQTITRKGEMTLTNAFTADADVITGKVTLQQKLPGESSFRGISFEPDVIIAGTEQAPDIQGAVTVSTLNGKNVLDSAVISLALVCCDASVWQSCEESLDLDLLSAEELEALQADVAMGVASSIVRPLIILLGDSADWFFRDMLPEQIQRITDAANTVVYH